MKNKNLSGNMFTKQSLTIKETPLSAQIKQYLDLRRIMNDRLNSGKVEVIKRYPDKSGKWQEYRNWLHLCAEGTPDRFAVIEGFLILIEVKQSGKKPTEAQIAKQREYREKAKTFVINTDSFDDFLYQLAEIEKVIATFKQLKETALLKSRLAQ